MTAETGSALGGTAGALASPELAARLGSRCIGAWPTLGLVSTDETAIVGKDGWLFLYQGSNRYFSGYFSSPEDSRMADIWSAYIDNARKILHEMNVKFYFSLVPNKASVLPDLYPFELPRAITGRAARVLARLDPTEQDGFESIRANINRHAIFRRNDTHLTEFGNLLLAHSMLRGVGLELPWHHYDFAVVRCVHHDGDLGHRFRPAATEVLRRLQHPLQTAAVTRRDGAIRRGAHLGSGYEASNPQAPAALRLLIFGNSFVEHLPSWGSAMQLCASVKTVRFVWWPGIDFAEVKAWAPDAVVFQTCERFLNRDPGLIN